MKDLQLPRSYDPVLVSHMDLVFVFYFLDKDGNEIRMGMKNYQIFII